MSDSKNILDRQITKKKNSSEVSLSAFSFLFCEMIQYTQGRVNQTTELQTKLEEFGYRIGCKFYELNAFREKTVKRETKISGILLYIQMNVWKTLYGEKADALERSEKETDCNSLKFKKKS
jgi:trafficking protein particle complex subunit 5